MMKQNIKMKKIYITDTILNKNLLNTSINKHLNSSLSNIFYKYKDISYKVNNIVNKINSLYIINDEGETIYNLAYQPYNQYNIFTHYQDNNFNKKWIIPLVNEQKTLFISDLETDKNGDKIREYSLIKYDKNENKNYNYEDDIDNIKYVEDDTDITYPNSNKFISSYDNNRKSYSNHEFTKLNQEIKEVPNIEYELKDISLYNSNNSITNNVIGKCIRIPEIDNKTYYLDSEFEIIDKKKDKAVYKKTIKESNNQLRNILENENINVNKFLIFNSMELWNTHFNIYLGNSTSYINEIINQKYFYLRLNNLITDNHNTHIYEDNIEIKSSNEQKFINYQIINKTELEFYKETPNKFIYNYFDIIKNLHKQNLKNKIYTIRDLKHIYNIYNYDLNKIPYCYIEYLQEILDSNVKQYILDNTNINHYLFKSYTNYLENKEKQDFEIYLQNINKLYNTDNYNFNNNNNIFELLFSNTFDLGILYNLGLYNKYLQESNIYKGDEIDIKDIGDNPCKKLKIVGKFDNVDAFEKAEFNKIYFQQLKYAENIYLIQYIDILNNINKLDENYTYDKIYKCSLKDLKFDDKKENTIKKINNDNAEQSPDECNQICNFIKNNKMYIYSLLLNLESDTDILFHAIQHYKYKGKYYVIIPYETIEINNLIYLNKELVQITNLDEFNYNKYTPNDNDCIFNEFDETITNKEYENKKFELENNKKINENMNNLNSINIDEELNDVGNRLDKQLNKKDFYNFKQDKYKYIEKKTFHLKTLRTLNYKISTEKSITDTITNYFKKSDYRYTEQLHDNMINTILNSEYKTDTITNINNTLNKIGIELGQDRKKITDICKYLNDYELFTNIIYNPNKYSRAYFKLYEILLESNILSNENFKLISLAEAPGHFVNCIINLKQQINNNWGNDTDDYKILTKIDDSALVSQGDFQSRHKNHIYRPTEKFDGQDFNGDLTKSAIIRHFVNNIRSNNLQADLITADGGIEKNNTIDYQLEEYNHIPLFLGEIITAIHTQKTGGVFILKMYDIIYENSLNLLYILKAFYKSVSIIKPYNSRPCNTEKYIICKDFMGNYDEGVFTNMLHLLDKLQQNILQKEGTKCIHFNILESLELDKVFIKDIEMFNNSIVIKSRELYMKKVFNIIKNKKSNLENILINRYFTKGKNILDDLVDNLTEDSIYFSYKIEQSILLANHMKIDIKPHLIEHYDRIKQLNLCSYHENCDITPTYFKEINDAIYTNNILELQKLADKHCITFENFNKNYILDYNIYKEIDTFIYNDNIKLLTHPLIQNLKNILENTDKEELKNYLINICKIGDIYKLFNIYQDKIKDSVISVVKHFQVNIRYLLGYYLCKNTYTPLFPKYKYYINLEDQLKYSVLYNSHYICFYSGDKLDIEEFDTFMGEEVYRTTNNEEAELLKSEQKINNDLTDIIDKEWIDNAQIDIKRNICLFIIDKFNKQFKLKLDDIDKIAILKNIDNFKLSSLDSIILSSIELKNFIKDYIYKYINETYNYNICALVDEIAVYELVNKDDEDLDEDDEDGDGIGEYHSTKTWFSETNETKINTFLDKKENLKNIYNDIDKDYLINADTTDDRFNIKHNDRIKGDLYKIIITQLIRQYIIKQYQDVILYIISILSGFIKKKSNKQLINLYYNYEISLIQKIVETYKIYVNDIINNITKNFENDIILNININFTEDNLPKTDDNKLNESLFNTNFKIKFNSTDLNEYIENIKYTNQDAEDNENDEDEEDNEEQLEWYHYYKTYIEHILDKNTENEKRKELKDKKSISKLKELDNKPITIFKLITDYNVILNDNGIDFDLYKYVKEHSDSNYSLYTFFNEFIKNIKTENFDKPTFYLNKTFSKNLEKSINYVNEYINLKGVVIDNTINDNNTSKENILINRRNIILRYKHKYEDKVEEEVEEDLDKEYTDEHNLIDNKILYLLIHVWEDKDESNNNKKRLFQKSKDTEEYICIYTKQTKKQILYNVLEIEKNNTIENIYNNTIRQNLIKLNNENLVHKNIKTEDNKNSLLNNLIYKFNNDDIQLIYKFIKLFYNYLIKNEIDVDLLNTILMCYSSDPINYIIQFKNVYEEHYIDKMNDFLETEKSYEYVKNEIDKQIDSDKNDSKLLDLIKQDISSNRLKKLNLVKTISDDTKPYSDLILEKINSSSDVILIINTIKKIILFIINIPLDINTQEKEIIKYIKNKFTFSKYLYKYYEFNNLIDNIYNNLYYDIITNLSQDDILDLQIVFDNILQEFNYNFNNIYHVNEEICKTLLLYKLLNMIYNTYKLIENAIYIISDDFKNRYFWNKEDLKTSSLNFKKFDKIKELEDNIKLQNENNKYKQIFDKILNISIKNIGDYSNSINNYEISDTEISQEFYDTVDNDELNNYQNIVNNIEGIDGGEGNE